MQIPGITASLGKSFKYNRQGIGGSSIRQRTRGNSSESTSQFEGYALGMNRGWSTGLDIVEELRDPQTLDGDLYDTLIVTERHDSIHSFTGEKTSRYLRHYHERLRAGNPAGQTYFYESWLSIKDEEVQAWFDYEDEAAKIWDCAVARVNHSLAAEGRTDRIRNLPAARALTHLVRKALAENVPGVTQSTTRLTLDVLFTDDVHLTAVGHYYMALVVYAYVYRTSPVGAAYAAPVTAAQAAALQNIAWEYIGNHLATHQPRTLAQCRAPALINAVCTAFWNYDWPWANDPSRIPSCISGLDPAAPSSPLYYDAATDAGFWFGPPAP